MLKWLLVRQVPPDTTEANILVPKRDSTSKEPTMTADPITPATLGSKSADHAHGTPQRWPQKPTLWFTGMSGAALPLVVAEGSASSSSSNWSLDVPRSAKGRSGSICGVGAVNQSLEDLLGQQVGLNGTPCGTDQHHPMHNPDLARLEEGHEGRPVIGTTSARSSSTSGSSSPLAEAPGTRRSTGPSMKMIISDLRRSRVLADPLSRSTMVTVRSSERSLNPPQPVWPDDPDLPAKGHVAKAVKRLNRFGARQILQPSALRPNGRRGGPAGPAQIEEAPGRFSPPSPPKRSQVLQDAIPDERDELDDDLPPCPGRRPSRGPPPAGASRGWPPGGTAWGDPADDEGDRDDSIVTDSLLEMTSYTTCRAWSAGSRSPAGENGAQPGRMREDVDVDRVIMELAKAVMRSKNVTTLTRAMKNKQNQTLRRKQLPATSGRGGDLRSLSPPYKSVVKGTSCSSSNATETYAEVYQSSSASSSSGLIRTQVALVDVDVEKQRQVKFSPEAVQEKPSLHTSAGRLMLQLRPETGGSSDFRRGHSSSYTGKVTTDGQGHLFDSPYFDYRRTHSKAGSRISGALFLGCGEVAGSEGSLMQQRAALLKMKKEQEDQRFWKNLIRFLSVTLIAAAIVSIVIYFTYEPLHR